MKIVACCATLLLLAPQYAHAVSLDTCRESVVKLDAASLEGQTDIWAEPIVEQVDFVNGLLDIDALLATCTNACTWPVSAN
jgi:hypothetical protein